MKVLGYGNVRGVDMERFSRRTEVMELAKLMKQEGLFTFVFVGRIVADKGINELMEAFERLYKQYNNARLLMIGKIESDLDPLKDQTMKILLGHSGVEYVGPKYGDELLACYAASDCFVFPSYREGFPNTVMEAGAMGLPSIVTDINGSREIIEHGVNGVIIPSKDVDALYNAMEQILIDKKRTQVMANNARPMIESRFEQSFVQKCLFDFYDEILND